MSSKIAIKAENISKQYRLGEVGTGTISHDLNRWWAKIRGKEDPFLKIGESNDRTSKGESDYVWSLRDISFEIQQGDAVGIIGRNGAGKSTLLKLLSKVTKPTTGSFKVKGRIASLLEVGTGFHPEMTGRENIYLNGAILGMRKHEIKRKFDEIVDFSGVERYIDTPVKRYSSGMYVRLAFAVAAHLESEILIVDEVLAVGDAEFQKKCLGKMGDVSKGEGKTVLFVSHNMEAVQNLCTASILLKNGQLFKQGNTPDVINFYINNFLVQKIDASYKKNEFGNDCSSLLSAKVSNYSRKNQGFTTIDDLLFEIEIDIEDHQQSKRLDATIHLVDERGILVCVNSTAYLKTSIIETQKGKQKINFVLPGKIINEGLYTVSRLILLKDQGHILTEWNDILSYEVLPVSTSEFGWQGQKEGVLKFHSINWTKE